MMWFVFHYSNGMRVKKKSYENQILPPLNSLWAREVKMCIKKLEKKAKKDRTGFTLQTVEGVEVQPYLLILREKGHHHKTHWNLQELLHLEFSLAYRTCFSLQSKTSGF